MIFLIRTIQALRVGMKSGVKPSANPLENMMNMFSTLPIDLSSLFLDLTDVELRCIQ